MHQPKWQLDWFTHFYTTTPQNLHWLQWDVPHLPPKLPLPIWQSPPPSNKPVSQPTPLTTPNSIHIQSAIFHNSPNGQTNRHRLTDGISNGPIPTPAYALLYCSDTANNNTWTISNTYQSRSSYKGAHVVHLVDTESSRWPPTLGLWVCWIR